MILYAAVAICGLLAVLLVARYDLYNREPFGLLVLAAAAGAVVMPLVGETELLALRHVQAPIAQAATAAVQEELARLLLVIAIAALFPRHFDDPMDGVIYGSMVGLGMALEESFHLLSASRETRLAAIPVEVVRLGGHLVMGGIAGFGVGLARMRMAGSARALVRSFAIALALHFSWDWVALAGAPLSSRRSLLGAAVMLAGILVYGAMVVLGSRLSADLFPGEPRRALWGWPFRSPRP